MDRGAPSHGLYAPGREGPAAWERTARDRERSDREKVRAASELALYAPPRNAPPPPVYERLVQPNTRAEILHGQVLWCAPALPEHGRRHFDLAALIAAHVAGGYTGAVDMLTRTSHDSDFAPDASIFPRMRKHTEDEERELEELAFEVVSRQPMTIPTVKARELARRGVRRVFAIVLAQKGRGTKGTSEKKKKDRVLEWSRSADGWVELAPDGWIEDRCLVKPIPVSALLDTTSCDEAIASALLAKNNRVIAKAREESHSSGVAEGRAAGVAEGRATGVTEGILQGKRDALSTILTARELSVSKTARARIDRCRDAATLDRWIAQAATAVSTKEALR